MLNFLKKLCDIIVFGNFFIAFCTWALFQYSFYRLSGSLSYDIEINIFIFFSSLISYNICRLFSERRLKEVEVQYRIEWVSENRRSLTYSTIVFICLTLYFFLFLTINSMLLVALISFLSILYAIQLKLPIINIDIRRIPYLKILIITFCWLSVCVGIPFFEILNETGKANLIFKQVVFHSVELFCFLLAITLPFDIRDYDIDKKDGIKTFPHLIGKRRTIIILVLLMLMYLVLIYLHNIYVIGVDSFSVDVYEFIFHIAYSLLIILLGYMSLKERSEYFHLIYIDGVCLLPILCIFF